MLLPAHLGERLTSPPRLRPVHRAVKLNQFPARIRHLRARQKLQTAFLARIRHSQARQKVHTAFLARIRHSQARHFATNCRPGTSIHPQTLLTDRCEVHFTALARVYVTFPLYRIFCTSEGIPPQKHRGPAPSAVTLCSLGAGSGTRLPVSGDSRRSRCRRRDETSGFQRFREVSVPGEERDYRFPGISSGLGAEGGTRPPVSSDSEWSRCRERNETIGFRGFRVVSVPEEGRDCRFRAIPRGLGAGRGTRPPLFEDSEWSRCWERDETADFGRIRVVSVPGEGRDLRFPGIPRGLGAECGTRLSVSGDSARSRCWERDETAGFGGIRVVSVLKKGRDYRFPANPCGLGAGSGTRLPVDDKKIVKIRSEIFTIF